MVVHSLQLEPKGPVGEVLHVLPGGAPSVRPALRGPAPGGGCRGEGGGGRGVVATRGMVLIGRVEGAQRCTGVIGKGGLLHGG